MTIVYFNSSYSYGMQFEFLAIMGLQDTDVTFQKLSSFSSSHTYKCLAPVFSRELLLRIVRLRHY